MENKINTSDLFIIGENHQGKILSSEFKITTPKNPLLSITSGYKYKESYQTLWPILKYQPTVEPLPPIPNWTCIVTAIFPLMPESQYVTN